MKTPRSQKSNTSRKADDKLVTVEVDLTPSNAAFLRSRTKELGISNEMFVTYLLVNAAIAEKDGKKNVHLAQRDIRLISETIAAYLSIDTEVEGTHAEAAAAWREMSPSYVEIALKGRRLESVEEAETVRSDNDRRADLLDYFSQFLPKQMPDVNEEVANA